MTTNAVVEPTVVEDDIFEQAAHGDRRRVIAVPRETRLLDVPRELRCVPVAVEQRAFIVRREVW